MEIQVSEEISRILGYSREEAMRCDIVTDVKLGDADYLDQIEDGKILFDKSGTTVRFSLKKEASSYADVTIKGNGKKRLCSMITWAESGAILIFFTPARFSTHPDFFKK